jgi:type VI secretion system protein VasG
MENPAILLRRLNPYCARAMEGAASLCQTRAHAEILPEHWLLKLLEQGKVTSRCWRGATNGIWMHLAGFARLAG